MVNVKPVGYSYIKDHPVVYRIAQSALLLGLVLMVAPVLAASSPSLAVLTPALTVLWGFAFGLGGLLSVIGMRSLKPKFEAAGAMLQGTAMLTTLLLAVVGGTLNPLSVLFLGGLALGLFERTHHLASR